MTYQNLMMGFLRAYDWFDAALQSRLKARGIAPNSKTQSLALVNISLGVRRSSQLARNLGVSRQAMSQVVQELEAKGLISLVPDPTDSRAQIIDVNPKSGAQQAAFLEIMAELEEELAARLGAARVQALREALYCDWGESPVLG